MKIAFLYQTVGITEERRKSYEEKLHVQILLCKTCMETLSEDCNKMIAKGADAMVVFNRAMVKRLPRMSLPVPVVVGEPTIGSLLYSLLQVKQEIKKEDPMIAVDCSVNYDFAGKDQHEAYRSLEKISKVRLVNMNREQLRSAATRRAEIERLKHLGVDAILVPASIGATVVSGYGVPVYDNVNLYSDESNFFAFATAVAELQELKYRREEMEMLRQLIEMSAQVSLCTDTEGKILFASAKAQSLLNSSELGGKKLKDLLPEIHQPLQRILSDGKNIDGIPITVDDTVWQANLSLTTKEKGMVLCTLGMVRRIRRIEQPDYQRLSEEGALAEKKFEDLVGTSPAFGKAMVRAQKYALCELPVFIVGEVGTGKKAFAQGIHNAGVRRKNAFVYLNCAAGEENIAETLFGCGEIGTKNRKTHKGCLERANGGTLFLDNVELLPSDIQRRLQLSLERRCVRRIGDTVLHPIDVRIIAATRLPAEKISSGIIEQELLYQLDVLRLELPPLRERRQDILLLFHLYFRRACEMQSRVNKTDVQGEELIQNYEWPGNIRQLIAFCQRLSVLAEGGSVDAAAVHEHLKIPAENNRAVNKAIPQEIQGLQQAEDHIICEALKKCGGNRKKAAEMLGISTTTLWRKCKAMGL